MKFNRVHLVILLLIGICMVAAVFMYRAWNTVPAAESFKDKYDVVLQDFEGKKVELADYKRELLVMHVWASWCPYCTEELQNLAKLKDIYGEKVEIIGVNRGEPKNVAEDFIRAAGVEGKITLLLDPDDAYFKEVGGYAMPETVFINSSGVIVFHQRGPMPLADLAKKMKELVGE